MGKKIDYSKIQESDILIDWIESRFKKGLYTLTFVYGLPGTGKSSTCLRLAELISERIFGKNLITEKNIVDSLVGLIDAIKKAQPGEAFVVEEISVLFPSRRAMSIENVAVGRVLDTCRKKQIILFANAPIFDSIDSHIRALAHISLECMRINKGEGVVISKPLILQTNPGSGKTYRHRFHRDGREVHLTYTRKPNEETWEDYEKRKDKFMEQLYNKLKMKQLKKDEKLQKEMGILPKVKVIKPLTEREIKIYSLVEREKMTHEAASKEMGVARATITQTMKRIGKKLQFAKEIGQSRYTINAKEAIK